MGTEHEFELKNTLFLMVHEGYLGPFQFILDDVSGTIERTGTTIKVSIDQYSEYFALREITVASLTEMVKRYRT